MNQDDTREMTEIVHNRIFKGGGIAGFWRVFRENQLTGTFIIAGDECQCTLKRNKGKLVKFSFADKQGEWLADEAFTRLIHLTQKSNVRFSLFTPN